jgi:V8-like Glu-specific endopeptidase
MCKFLKPCLLSLAIALFLSGCNDNGDIQTAIDSSVLDPVSPEASTKELKIHLAKMSPAELGSIASRKISRTWADNVEAELVSAERTPEEIEVILVSIRKGSDTTGHHTVGLLMRSFNGAPAVAACSGTMVGFGTFLTAAHCVENQNENAFSVYLQHAGYFEAENISTFCGDRASAGVPCQGPEQNPGVHDIAIVQLDLAGLNANQSKRLTMMGGTPIGQAIDWQVANKAQIVGFGMEKIGGVGWPIKREGEVTIETCIAPQDSDFICLSYSGDKNANCGGDSGGPMFSALADGSKVVVGVASQIDADCGVAGTGRYVDITLPIHTAWIASKIQTVPTMNLLSVSVADDAQGLFFNTGIPDKYRFDLPVGIQQLLVTVNFAMDHNDGSGVYRKIDFDLLLEPPNACDNQLDQVGTCTVSNPSAGHWTASVHPTNGKGFYQLTIMAIMENDVP